VGKLDKKTFLALWLFNPFISAIYTFRDFKYNTNIGPYLLISLFFGVSFVVSTSGGDSERYAEELVRYHQQNISLNDVLDSSYDEGGSKLDVYQPLVTWVVSTFTANIKVLFSVFAIVFGYFWFKSLIIIRSFIAKPLNGLLLLAFLLLVLTNPIWKINGVRMWTAVGVFFYGIVLLHFKNDKKGWIFLVLPMLIHFSLIISLVLYIAYRILPLKNTTILFGLFIFSFFLGELNLDILRSYFELLPSILQSKQGYVGEEYVEKVGMFSEQHNLNYLIANLLNKYVILVMVIIVYYNMVFNKKISEKYLNAFFPVALFFLTFSNFAASVPSGGRFATVSNLMLVTAFLLFLNQDTKMNIIIKGILNGSLFYIIIFEIRIGLETTGVFFFIGNPIVNWFIIDSPLINFFKSIF
jgi:hypothetical protein